MRLLSSTSFPRRKDWDPEERLGDLLLHRNENYIAQSLTDKTVHVLDSSGVLLRTFVHPVDWVWGLAFDEDNIIMSSSKEAIIRIYKIYSGLDSLL